MNGEKISICALEPEDVIDIGGIEMTLVPISRRQEERLAELRTQGSTFGYSFLNVFLLSLFQILCSTGFLLSSKPEYVQPVLMGFGGILICQWLLLIFYAAIRRTSFEVESIAFFLCTMGMCAICTVVPGETLKQLIAMVMGIFLFLTLGWCLRDLERAN